VAVVGGPFMDATNPPAALTVPASAPFPDERRWKRTPPTESDPRKLFVGGLPTNGKLLCGLRQCVFFIVVIALPLKSLELMMEFGT
jgi:hypothetical protein